MSDTNIFEALLKAVAEREEMSELEPLDATKLPLPYREVSSGLLDKIKAEIRAIEQD